MHNTNRKERIIESSVNEEHNGLRLDLYLAKRFSYMSRTLWQREITAGKLKLNGSVILNVKKHIYAGDFIEYIAGEIIEPAIDPGYSIIF